MCARVRTRAGQPDKCARFPPVRPIAGTLGTLGTPARRAGTGTDMRMARARTPGPCVTSLDDLDDLARADGAATLTDGEAEALLHRDRLDQLDRDLGVVAGHDHLGALRQRDDTGDVGGAEVELGTVVPIERVVTPALVLGQDVDLAAELGVRRDRAGLDDDLAALDVLTLRATQQQTDVLAGLRVVEQLAEHLDAGDRGLDRLLLDADDLHLLVHLELAALDATGDDGATTSDREDVLDRHEKRLVDVTDRVGDAVVDGLEELIDRLDPLGVALERLERRDPDHRDVVAVEALGREQLADLDLDELQELLVVDHVGLVQRDEQVRHADLTGEQDVLTRLGHGAVGRRDHEDRAVHLRGTRDHVLDVVGVTRRIDVRVVALLGLVLDVRDVDRDTALLLFRRLVDLVERREGVQGGVLVVQHLRDRGRQRRLAVVDVTNGPDVDVRLGPLELRLAHWVLLRTLVEIAERLQGHAGTCGTCGPTGRLCGVELQVATCGTYSPRVFLMISSATFRGTSA